MEEQIQGGRPREPPVPRPDAVRLVDLKGSKEASVAAEQAKSRVITQLAFTLKWEPWRFGVEEGQGPSYIFKESSG